MPTIPQVPKPEVETKRNSGQTGEHSQEESDKRCLFPLGPDPCLPSLPQAGLRTVMPPTQEAPPSSGSPLPHHPDR